MATPKNVNIDANSFEPRKSVKRPSNAIDDNAMEVDSHNKIEGRVRHQPKSKRPKENMRIIRVPAHRYTPLKQNWLKIYEPVTNYCNLDIKFNIKARTVEIRTKESTGEDGNLQKAADFVQAFVYGFEVTDALALLRLDELFIETFVIDDVKTLKGDHKSRAIGRLAGKGGCTKHTIENATKTRVVLADSKIHILGAFKNIMLARRAICKLIVGAPSSKVYGQLRGMATEVSDRM